MEGMEVERGSMSRRVRGGRERKIGISVDEQTVFLENRGTTESYTCLFVGGVRWV